MSCGKLLYNSNIRLLLPEYPQQTAIVTHSCINTGPLQSCQLQLLVNYSSMHQVWSHSLSLNRLSRFKNWRVAGQAWTSFRDITATAVDHELLVVQTSDNEDGSNNFLQFCSCDAHMLRSKDLKVRLAQRWYRMATWLLPFNSRGWYWLLIRRET